MNIKHDVDIKGIRPEIVLAAQVVQSIYRQHNQEAMITSGLEGQHMPGSFHYKGLALDFRLPLDPSGVVGQLRDALGPQFDVVLEKDHIHVEFDPKTKATS